MKIVLVTQARMSSSRLPQKVLLPLGRESVLGNHLRRLNRVKGISEKVVATTEEAGVESIVRIAQQHNWSVYQGSIDDVLDRFYQAVRGYAPDVVIRVTSDCPLIDPLIIDHTVDNFLKAQVDYASNCINPTWPDGADCEVFRFAALEKAWREASLGSEREHVTPYIWKNSNLKGKDIFSGLSVESAVNNSDLRFTLDESADYVLLQNLVNEIGGDASMEDYMVLARSRPEWLALNSHIKMNEGYAKSLQKDKLSHGNN